MPSRRWPAVPALVLALLCGACGGAPAVRVTSPFSASDATVFDQGVDFVDDPDILEGHWQEDWTHDFQHRVGSSDVVEVVHIMSMRTSTQPDEEPTYSVDISPDRALLGEAVDVDLSARTSDSGYASLDTNQRRLLSGTFLLFVKFAAGEDGGAPVPRWHLSPASEKILAQAQHYVDARVHPQPQDQATVTEHTN